MTIKTIQTEDFRIEYDPNGLSRIGSYIIEFPKQRHGEYAKIEVKMEIVEELAHTLLFMLDKYISQSPNVFSRKGGWQ